MSSLPNGLPISLRAAPNSTSKEIPLNVLIGRINAERGSFRNLTEDGLRQEIAEAEAGGNEEESESSSEEEEEENPDRMKELLAARDEILGHLNHAHNASMIELDFISLLLSKDAPVQASLSLSQALREAVGMGTLGCDKMEVSRVTEQQIQDNRRIAKGRKASNLNKTVDSILASATRLEKEIDAETKYWEQVLAVTERGWAVCRLPQEKHTLGVRFGFSEAAPAFRNRSLGALRRNPDGSIILDQGIASTQPQSLRVSIETNGVITGETILPKAVPDDAPIQDVIFQARNTIFASELWQELHREVRSLASYGVQSHTKTNTITCPLSPTKNIILELLPLPNDPFRPILGPRPDSYIATGIYLTLHLLLSLAHRQNHRKRTTPPPPISSNPRPNHAYHLLRSLLTRVSHESSISSLHSLLAPLCKTLRSSSLSTPPTYTITPSTSSPFPRLPTPEKILTSFIDRLESITTLILPTPSSTPPSSSPQPTTLTIQTVTALLPFSRPSYRLTITPSTSPLLQICPPPQALGDFHSLKEYTFWLVGCWLAFLFSDTNTREGEGSGKNIKGEEYIGWKITPQANVLRKTFQDKEGGGIKQIVFGVGEKGKIGNADGNGNRNGDGIKISIKWEWTTGSISSTMEEIKEERKLNDGEGVYEWFSGGRGKTSGFGVGDGELEEVVRKIGEVVKEAGRGRKS